MPFSECGEQAVGVGREQGDQGGGCVMVQEGGDGGRAICVSVCINDS